MPKVIKPRRSYQSPRRREQALATRRSILEAARQLFVDGGYVPTTIDAIAAAAGVSPETVYSNFKSKRSLLSSLIDISLAGDDAPVPILDRPWVQQLGAQTDARQGLRVLARNGRLILERSTPVYDVLRGAAAADPEVASLWESTKAQRYAGQSALLRILRKDTPLRPGLTAKAATDILFAIGSPETYRLLTIDRGWSADRFERWYAETIARLLFA